MRKLKLFFACLLMAVLSIGQMWASFSKATSIEAGDVVAFVCEGSKMDLTSISSTSTPYGIGTSYTSSPACTWTFTVETGSAEGSFAFKSGNNYLSWSSGNSLTTSTTKNANSSWTVVISDGHATITNVNTTNRVIWWNVSSPRFACYTSKSDGSSYKYTQIYKQVSSTKTLESVAISGTATALEYNDGDEFNPAGLKVVGHYSDNSDAEITDGITWAFDPATLSEGDESVSVTATVGGKTSAAFAVNGLTVAAAPAASNWQVIAPENLATGDVVVLTMNVGGTYYAASNNNGTSNPPSATSVAVTGSSLSTTPATTLQWTVTVVSEGVFQFAVGDKKMYCTDTNNGVRVGTDPTSGTFCNTFDIYTATDSKLYLHTTESMPDAENGRYVGVYNAQNWRCYTSVNNNIKGGSLVIFKENDNREAAGLEFATKQYLIKKNATFSAPELINPNSLPVTYLSSNTDVAEVAANGAITIKADATGAATITASFDGDETYKDGSASYTIFVAEKAGTNEEGEILTEAIAKELIDLGCTLDVYVTGTILTPQYYDQSKTYTVTLTDGFQFYYFYAGPNEEQFDADILTAGDVLVAYGNLKKSGNNYRLNPCYMVSREPYSEPKVDISNTEATAYTPAQAIALYNDVTSDLTKTVYVKGVVVASPAIKYNSELTDAAAVYNGTYNVYVKAENDDSENPTKFEFFRMYADENNSTFEEGDIQVGNLIVAKGLLSKYQSTYEFAQGCQMVSKKSKATMTFDDLDLVVDDVETLAPKTITLAQASAIVYTIKEGSDDCVTISGAEITATAEGSATIVATLATTDDYIGTSVEFTVVVTEEQDTRKVAHSPAAFTTTSGNLDPADITFEAFKGGAGTAPANYNNGIRLYQAPSASAIGGYITLTAVAGCTIDEVQITTTGTYATTVTYSIDGNETLLKSESVAKSGSYTTSTGLNVQSVNIVNKGTSSSGRLEIASIKVYYTGDALTIDHYELGGTYATEFEVGDDFNHNGLIVYAAYDALGENKVDITSACSFSTPDMSTEGQKTIDITYKEEVVKNYTITVNASTDTRKVADSPATFTAVSGDMAPADITFAAYKGGAGNDPYLATGGIRLYQISSSNTFGGFITLKAKKGCTIDQVKITTSAEYATTVAYSVDGNENLLGSESVAKSSDYTTPAGLNVESVNILNLGTGSSGRLEIASIKVWYTGDALSVDHYILGGTYATEFEQYGEFNFEGLTVTAAYDELETITEAVTGFTVEADLSTAGNKKAEVKLNNVKIAEYDITVTASAKVDPELAYNPASVILTKGDALSAPVLSNEFVVSPISFVSDKPAVATVDAEGNISLAGGIGVAVITASFAGNDDYLASEATFTITVNEPAEDLSGTWVVATSIAAGDRIIIADVAAAGVVYTMGGQNSNNRAAVASTVDEYGVLTPAEGTKTFLVVDAENGEFALQALNDNYLYAASTSSNHLKETSDINNVNAKWTITIENGIATIKALHEGHTSRNWMRKNSSDAIFSCYGSGQNDIVIYKIGTPDYGSYQRDVTNGNYGTICLPKAGVISGATLFEIADYANNMIYVDEILSGEMEAGKPYIFQATSDQLNVVYTAGTIVDEAGHANGLYGFYDLENENAQKNLDQNDGNYILYQNAYWLVSGRDAYIANYRAYIKLSQINNTGAQAPGRRRVAMAVNGEQVVTGIGELNASEAPVKMIIDGQLFIIRGEKMYNANGQLVK